MEAKQCNTGLQKKQRKQARRTILTSLSKVYERLMYDQIYITSCTVSCWIYPGFHETTYAILLFLACKDGWRRRLDQKEFVAAVAEDHSKTFASINHHLLLTKLHAYGFPSSAIRLMESWTSSTRLLVIHWGKDICCSRIFAWSTTL